MRIEKFFRGIILIICSFIITACTNIDLESYNNALQKGLDTLAVENYAKAEDYFELALEEKPEDEKATAYLNQTLFYQTALTAYENNDLETTKEKLEQLTEIKNGSESLIIKAELLQEQILHVQEVMANYQKEYRAVERLLAEEKLEEASTKVTSVLNSSEISQNYFAEIKTKMEEIQKELETKQADLAALKESKAREEGPNDIEILPNIREGGETFAYLRSTTEEKDRTYKWKREIEELHGNPIDSISNQEIADYLLEYYNQKQQFADMIENGNQSQKEEMLQEYGNPIAAFDALPLSMRALLAATVVDKRAATPALQGFTLQYNVEGDYFIVNIHSGAGVGHPWYVLRDDGDTITPVDGLVYLGIDGYKDASVDPTPVSKEVLFDLCFESKWDYDAALNRINETPEMTLAEFSKLRSLIED